MKKFDSKIVLDMLSKFQEENKNMKEFEEVYETGGTFPDYFKCVYCGERVERGISSVSHHWLNCEKNPNNKAFKGYDKIHG